MTLLTPPGRALPETTFVSSYCPRARASWGVAEYEAAPEPVRADLRRRYAEALDAFRALPGLPDYEARATRSRACSGRPAFTDPAGRPLSAELAAHLEDEIDSDRRIAALLAEARRFAAAERNRAAAALGQFDIFDHLTPALDRAAPGA